MSKLRATIAAVAAALGIGAISPLGFDDIRKHEGLRLTAYADPYLGWKKPTICYGHTKGVYRGTVATLDQCEAWLIEDIMSHCAIVDAWGKVNKYVFTQGEYDAYCSFVYNTGYFGKTASVAHRIKADPWAACMGLLKYYYSDGQPSRGLWERRYREYNTCISTLSVHWSRR